MAITFPFCFLWMSLSLDLQDLSCLWWEDNYSWLHFSPLASFKMSNSGSVHDGRFAPWVFCQPQAQARALPPQRQPGRSNVWPLSAHGWARGKLLSPSCHFLEPSSPRLDVQIFDTQNCTFELGEQSCVSGFALLCHLCETDLQTSTPRWGCTRFPQEKVLLARWGSFTSFSSGKLQASGYMFMSLWHRNKLNQILLLLLSGEITLYTAHSCPKSPSSVSIHRFYAQDISASKEILLRKNAALSGKTGVLLLWICAVEEKKVSISSVRMAIEPKEWKNVHLMLSQKGIFRNSFVKLRCFI